MSSALHAACELELVKCALVATHPRRGVRVKGGAPTSVVVLTKQLCVSPAGLLTGAKTLDRGQRNKCHAIIHVASTGAAAIGAGLAQIPLADNAVIVPIQITMVMSLGKVFNVSLSKSAAEGTALGATATLVGRTTSQVLLGWIPVLGNAINAATAAAITEAMGWAVAAQFARGQIKGSSLRP